MTGSARTAAVKTEVGCTKMTKFLATAGAAALLALTSATAQAATSPSAQANATAKIYHPLTITKKSDLDFGVIVITNTAFTTGETVTVGTGGTITACGVAADLTCTGTPKAAAFTLKGNNNANVVVSSPAFNLTGPATLAVTPSSTSQVVNLGTTGDTTGVDVPLGASISLLGNTPEGVYSGTWTVTADYQ